MLPPQVKEGEIADFISVVSKGVKVTILLGGALGIAMNLLFGFALSFLWTLLHALVLIVHLPLFSVQFPGYAFMLYEQLIAIARFDLIETEETVV